MELVELAVRNLIEARYAIALTGAGISTESGIPDFRGPSGVWTKNPDAERRAYRSYDKFLENPKAWWEERLCSPGVLGDLGTVEPNSGHYALAELEQMGIIKCVITQNVDGLHEKAGSKNVLEYHGSYHKLRCIACTSRFTPAELDLAGLREQKRLPPLCPKCGGIIKTDGVAFGEPIPGDVSYKSIEEAQKCDVMLICGTSAVVYPFAHLPRMARQKSSVTIIEVNAEPTPLTEENISDYLIRGKTGEILPQIVRGIKAMGGGTSSPQRGSS